MKRSIAALVWTLSTLATAQAAGPPAAASEAGRGLTVKVQVLASVSGKPIARANIDVFDTANVLVVEQASTNKDGVALIDRLPPTALRFQVTPPNGWQPESRVVDVGQLKAPPAVRFELPPKTAVASRP
jgi:hypothetical protein